jgi:uncharacterized protein (TIGR03437 family)
VAAPEVRSICGDVGKVYLLKVTLSLTVLSWFSYGLIAQTSALSLSSAVVNPGGTATLGLALTVSGTAPSGLQWTITYSPTQISGISIAPGPSASAATKTLYCAAAAGAATCLLTGLSANTIGSGVVAYLSATAVPGATTASIQISNPIGVDSSGNGLGVTSAVSGTIIVPSLLPVTCSPTALSAGAVSTCTVTLTQTAPPGGSSVTVASNNTSLTVPASVTVPAGASAVTFSATAAASISSNQSAVLTASLGSSSQTPTINLLAPVLVSGVACSPTSLGPSAVSTCAVTLTAPTSGSSVTLASSNASLAVPASVTVAAGATSAAFSATASATFTSNQTATVVAALGSSSQTVIINGANTTPVFIQEEDNRVTSGQTSSATFSSPTTAGNLIVVYLIWDSTGTASVSDSLGNTYAAAVAPTQWSNSQYSVQTFYAINLIGGPDAVTATFATAVNSFGIIYAHEYSGVAQTTPIDVTAAAAGVSGSLNSGSATTTNNTDLLFAGGVSANVVTSPGAGYTARSTSDGNITEDQIVSATGSYNATASNSSGAWAMQMVAFKAAVSGPVLVSGVTCSPTSLGQSTVSACAVTLTQTASTGGLSVMLTSNNTFLAVPSSVTVAAGATTATFSATAAASFLGNQSAFVTATLGTSSQTAVINLVASVGPVTFLQSTSTAQTGGQTASTAFPGSVTSGDLIIVGVFVDVNAMVSVTDTFGSSFTQVTHQTVASDHDADVFVGTASASGTDTITVNAGGKNVYAFSIHEYGGVTTAVDVSTSAQGNSTAPASGSLTTVTPNDLIFAWFTSGNDYQNENFSSLNAAYTKREMSGSGTAQCNAYSNCVESGDLVAATTLTTNATATLNVSDIWSATVIAFIGAPSNLPDVTSEAMLRGGGSAGNQNLASFPTANTVSSLRCSPGVINAGGTVTCELLIPASRQSALVDLKSSSEQVRIPAVITTHPNQSSLTFQAQSNPVSKQQPVTITATLDTAEIEDTILLMGNSGPVLRVPERQVTRIGVPISFTVSAVDSSGLSPQIEGTPIPGGASFDPVTGTFQWSPKASQTGKYRITFTATSSGRQSSTGEVELEVDSGLPVLNAPTSSCSPGGIATLSGTSLAVPGSQLSDPSGSSFDLGGTEVTVNGRSVPLLQNSAARVEFLCPVLPAGSQLLVEVATTFGSSQPVTMGMQDAVPTILSLHDSQQNQGLISFYGMNDLVMERNFREPSHPAQPGDRIVILATGLGSAADSWSGTMLVRLGDVYVGVDSVQAVPGYAGVYAIQLLVPAAMTFGTVPVQLQMMTLDGREINSNSVTAAFEAVRQ